MNQRNTGGVQMTPAQRAAVQHEQPATHNRAVGARGETIAAAYLEGLGYRIVDRNWHNRYGELDLVAIDGDTLVAVEVKTRTGLGYGHPLQAITQRKVDRLRRLLLDWCRTSNVNASGLANAAGRSRTTARSSTAGLTSTTDEPRRLWWEKLRIDAIGIVLRQGLSPSITHLQGIS